jgi:hypothetical protein
MTTRCWALSLPMMEVQALKPWARSARTTWSRSEELAEDARRAVAELDRRSGQIEFDAGVAGEGHLDGRGEQAAVGAIVIGEEFLFAAELLDDVPEILQIFRAVDVGRVGAGLIEDLREQRAAEAVLAAAEVDEEEDGVLLWLIAVR